MYNDFTKILEVFMKSKLVTKCVAVLCTMAILSACGQNNASVSSQKTEKTKIRFASWDVAEDFDVQQKLVDEFNSQHNDIEVVLEAYGKDFDTKISAGMGSKDAPDVMYMWNYPAYSNGLEPLDSYIEKEGEDFKKNYYSALWDYNSIDNKIYGMPVGFTTHALFYNKDLFEKAGVSLPTENYTWDDLRAAAKTITEKTEAKGFAFQMKPDPYDFEMYLWSNNSAYCDDKGKMSGKINSPESEAVFKMFQDMAKEEIAAVTEGNGTDEFRAGQVAMYIYGSWSINSLNEDKMNYGITKLPSFGAGSSVSILSSSGVAMSKDSKNKEAAWEFMKFWTGEKANKARIGLELPVLETVIQSEKIMEDQTYAPFYKMLEQSSGHTPASFIMENWSEVSENLSLSFEEMFNPSSYADVKETLEQAVKQ